MTRQRRDPEQLTTIHSIRLTPTAWGRLAELSGAEGLSPAEWIEKQINNAGATLRLDVTHGRVVRTSSIGARTAGPGALRPYDSLPSFPLPGVKHSPIDNATFGKICKVCGVPKSRFNEPCSG